MQIELSTIRNRPYLHHVESRRRTSRNDKPISGKRLVQSHVPTAFRASGYRRLCANGRRSASQENAIKC